MLMNLRKIIGKIKFPIVSVASRRYLSFGNHVEQFKTDGVVCLRGCFSEQWVNVVKRGIQKTFKNPSEYSQKLTSDGGKGVYFNDYLQWRKVSEFTKFIKESPAVQIAAAFMQENEVAFYHEHVFIKENFNESATPWHHDQSYYPIDGWKNCSVWMPVTPVEGKSLVFLKGSHKWGKWFAPRYFETAENYAVEEGSDGRQYETMPEINEDEHEILSWDMEPGDCLVFHMRAVHGSFGTSSILRQTLVTRWLGSDATFARRPWKPSPPVMGSVIYGDLVKNDQQIPVYSVTEKKYVSGFE